MVVAGQGNGPLEAFVNAVSQALGVGIEVLDYQEHAIGAGATARAAAYVEMRVGGSVTLFGSGIDANIVAASMQAVLSGLTRARRRGAGRSTSTASQHHSTVGA
jgi:2-isopropylmalate synthase